MPIQQPHANVGCKGCTPEPLPGILEFHVIVACAAAENVAVPQTCGVNCVGLEFGGKCAPLLEINWQKMTVQRLNSHRCQRLQSAIVVASIS